MALNINGTTGISGVDGSASTPALQGTDSNTGINFGSDTVNINTGGTTRATVDSSGKLGLGTTSPSYIIHTSSASGASRVLINNTTHSNGFQIGVDGNGSLQSTVGNYGHLIYTNGSERMRITSGGALCVGRTSDPLNSVKLMVQNGSNNVFYAYHEGTGNNYTILCRNDRAVSSTQATQIIFIGSGNTAVGDIRSTGSSTAYNTSSDYRLKENVTAISDGITRLKTLKPYKFNFISNPSQTVDGFLAHEVTAVPEAISGTKDEVVTQAMIDNGDAPPDSKLNDPIYQQIDQAKLVPLLTAALQEAVAKIETLETKVAALEAG